MTLNEIKEKIIAQFSQMTIDDFLLDYNIAAKIFIEAFADEFEHHSKSQENSYGWQKPAVEVVLIKILGDKFNESTYEYLTKCAEELKNERNNIKKELNTPNKELPEIEKEINEKFQQILASQKGKEESENIVAQKIIEINTLKTLAVDNPQYAQQVKNLEDAVASQNDKIQKFSLDIETFENALKELNVKRDSVKENITEISAKIEKIDLEITTKEYDIKQSINETEAIEYNALCFLYTVILYKEITKDRYKSNNRSRDNDLNLKFYTKEEFEFGQVLQFVSAYLKKTEYTIPKKWRRILFEILANPIPDFLGMASGVKCSSANCFILEKAKLTPIDSSFLLALKIAMRSNHSLKTKNNKIILGLSGGMTATISFRLKDIGYSKFQKYENEIYANYFYKAPYSWETLYKQMGYADSEISIKIPYGYIILSKDYFIEMEFSAAPILFESSNITRLAPNISSKAKQDDESSAKELAEQIRQAEEDAYWESLDDDD
jgi:hypothetical protein